MRRNCVARTAAPSLSRQRAQIGALNQLGGIRHRRDALRQVERAGTLEGPLLRQSSDSVSDDSEAQPLEQMNVEERLAAAYAGMGLTVGKHPMHYCLETLLCSLAKLMREALQQSDNCAVRGRGRRHI